MSQPSEQSNKAPPLFTPFSMRGVAAKNRIAVSPMCQYRSVEGGPTDWHLVHLGKFAIGGAAIIFGDETAVEARGRKTHACAGIYTDKHVADYRRITDFIKSLNAIPAIQLGHSGRKASAHGAMRKWAPLQPEDAEIGLPPWIGLAPSPIPSAAGAHIPKEMDKDDIRTMLDTWRTATKRAVDAGYDICEIHGAHGYLIHQFLSPLSNKRTDAYGGDREGRMRFALEIAEVVRETWPKDRPVFYRASVVDGYGGAWFVEDSIALAHELRARNIDLIDCSSGGIRGDTGFPLIPRVPGYHVSYASTIREQVGISTMTVGLITDSKHANSIVQSGKADLIAMARGLMWDCEWPMRAAHQLGVEKYFDVMVEDYAYRFYGRQKSSSGYPHLAPATIPYSLTESVPYEWPADS